MHVMKQTQQISTMLLFKRIETWGEEESLSSLETRGSMERITLATAWDGEAEEEVEEESGGALRERETNPGHFINHTDLSALLVSR